MGWRCFSRCAAARLINLEVLACFDIWWRDSEYVFNKLTNLHTLSLNASDARELLDQDIMTSTVTRFQVVFEEIGQICSVDQLIRALPSLTILFCAYELLAPGFDGKPVPQLKEYHFFDDDIDDDIIITICTKFTQLETLCLKSTNPFAKGAIRMAFVANEIVNKPRTVYHIDLVAYLWNDDRFLCPCTHIFATELCAK